MRGDSVRALAELERVMELTGGSGHLAAFAAAPRLLQQLNRLGRSADAVTRGREILGRTPSPLMQHLLLPHLALAEAAAGDLVSAREHADTAVAACEARGANGVSLGLALEMRARVALHAKDAAAFNTYAQRCREPYQAGENPALAARFERLLRDGADAGLVQRLGATPDPTPADPASLAWDTVIGSCRGPVERAERALRLIAEHSGLPGGYLYTLQHHGPMLMARVSHALPPPQLDPLVARYLADALDDARTLHEETARLSSTIKVPDAAREQAWAGYVPMLLSHLDHERVVVTGVAVMLESREHMKRAPRPLLAVLSRSLIDTGDVPTHIEVDWRTS
jgi:hypothetical protein